MNQLKVTLEQAEHRVMISEVLDDQSYRFGADQKTKTEIARELGKRRTEVYRVKMEIAKLQDIR